MDHTIDRELAKRLRLPWEPTDGKREIICKEAADTIDRLLDMYAAVDNFQLGKAIARHELEGK